MTKYREIIRLAGLGLSQTNIALSCNASKTTVNKVLKAAREQNLTWPLDPKLTDPVLCGLLFPNQKAKVTTYPSGCQIMPTSARNFSATE